MQTWAWRYENESESKRQPLCSEWHNNGIHHFLFGTSFFGAKLRIWREEKKNLFFWLVPISKPLLIFLFNFITNLWTHFRKRILRTRSVLKFKSLEELVHRIKKQTLMYLLMRLLECFFRSELHYRDVTLVALQFSPGAWCYNAFLHNILKPIICLVQFELLKDKESFEPKPAYNSIVDTKTKNLKIIWN